MGEAFDSFQTLAWKLWHFLRIFHNWPKAITNGRISSSVEAVHQAHFGTVGIFRAEPGFYRKLFRVPFEAERRVVGGKDEEEAKEIRERGKKPRSKRNERGGGENAFAYEIKWRIYTVRSQYTYVRPTVNYTVNRRVLFDRRGKEALSRARCPTRTKDESPAVRGDRGKGDGGGGKGRYNDGQVYGARDDLRDDS